MAQLLYNSRMRRIAFLSFVAALGGILFGYDTAVVSGTTAAVAERFGLDAMAKGWYVGCALVGSICGVAVAGWLSDRFGRKPTMLFSSILFSVSAIGCAICVGFADLVAYRIIGGVGIGIVSIVSPVYISEISPPKTRGTLVALYQFAITLGFVLAYLVNYLLLVNLHVDDLWRVMLGAEAVITLFFFATIFFITESPRWLASRTAAGAQRRRIPWEELLKPGIVKAILVGCAIAVLGQFMGVNAVLYYGPEIFARAGFAAQDSSFSTVLVGVVNMASTILAVFLVDRIGRKALVYSGVSMMIACLVAIGVFEAVAKETGDGGYLGVADRARAFIDAGPFRTWNWDGQFEDMDPMPPYVDLTPVRAFGFSQLLFRKGRTDDARLTLSWCEDQFAVWSDPIHHMDWKNWKMPTGLEQYDYYTPIDATMANFVRSFLVAWKATGEELYLEKARAMADCIVRNQRKDGTIPTYFDSRGGSDWVNCMASSADSLMAFAEALKSAGKATAGR